MLRQYSLPSESIMLEFSQRFIKNARLVTAFMWAVIIVNWVVGLPVFSSVIHWAGLFFAVVHFIELCAFSGKIKHSQNKLLDAFQIFVFGYFHTCTLLGEPTEVSEQIVKK